MEKELSSQFPREMRKDNWYYLPHCKPCTRLKKKDIGIAYREKNKEKLTACKKTWYLNNKDKTIARVSLYRKNNRNRYNELVRKRYDTDPVFNVRESVRKIIYQALKKNKNGVSISKYLNYSIIELKEHLENQFESWMNWNNHGRYDTKTWNDSNQITWTWQIDHIVPQADLIYASMEDDNFKKCWALENLRPFSAKQNIIDGSSGIRHKEKI